MKKVFKIIIVVILIAIALIFLWFAISAAKPAVSRNYTKKVSTGGEIEKKYLNNGEYDVGYFEKRTLQSFKKYEVYYPMKDGKVEDLTPAVVICNGTGVKASKYPTLLEHLASWGFVVIATEEEFSWNGFSAEMCVRFLEKLNTMEEIEDIPKNPLYGKIDMDNIGLSGHSQGGVGVMSATTNTQHKEIYKTICAQSPTNIPLAKELEWDFDPTKIQVPILLLSSTGDADVNLVIDLEGLQEIYSLVPNTVTKVMARRNDANHGDMLSFADGYVTAWFMWQLQGDNEASKAFIGEDAEMSHNDYYQDFASSILEESQL